MVDGTRIQERDISNVSSIRRNPALADIFAGLVYMERQGSGFKKIREAYHQAVHFREELEPKFYSDSSDFCVTLYNLNYGVAFRMETGCLMDRNSVLIRLLQELIL